mgnify:CR=1 FL=1
MTRIDISNPRNQQVNSFYEDMPFNYYDDPNEAAQNIRRNPLLAYPDLDAVLVDFRLPERFQSKIKPGQKTQLNIDALPGRPFAAAGSFISLSVPLLVFFTLQRYFIRGLTAGAVK